MTFPNVRALSSPSYAGRGIPSIRPGIVLGALPWTVNGVPSAVGRKDWKTR